jgi:hypothetical protein
VYVYLIRVVTQGLIILTVTMLGLGFPYSAAVITAAVRHRRFTSGSTV